MPRRHLIALNMITLAACGLPFAAGPAAALDPAPEGATMTVSFRVTVQGKSQGEFNSASVKHVLKAQCSLLALAPSQMSWDGPSAEQEAAAEASAAQGEALSQQMQANDQGYAAMLEAEAAKCGADEACLMQLTMKLANDPNFLAQQQQMQADVQAAQKLQPDLGPVRYQQWNPQTCTGTLEANDTYVTSDPGGEGGDGAYTDTVTIAAAGPVAESSWPGLFLQTDLVEGTTTYKMIAPPPVSLPSTSSMTGAGTQSVALLGGNELPVFGPYPGGVGKHKGSAQQDGAAITAEWMKGD